MNRRVFLGTLAAGAALGVRKRHPSCTPEDAYPSTAAVPLAMVAPEAGGRGEWDASTEDVRDNPRASTLLKREYCAPWTQPFRA
jgi:hypothetical protein